MFKIKTRWSGFTGSPGWTNFYFDTGTQTTHGQTEMDSAAARTVNFWSSIKSLLPPTVTLTVQSDVEIIDPNTGQLTNVGAVAAQPAQTGSATAAPYSAATGAVMTLRTAGVRNGRRVRGRTFIVPTASSIFATDGTLGDANITTIQSAATTLIGAAASIRLGVYARPTTKGGTDGQWYPITSATVPDLAAVLRSRRD